MVPLKNRQYLNHFLHSQGWQQRSLTYHPLAMTTLDYAPRFQWDQA
jgi:hypothetical protein